jgi:peptidoglycan/LPS O-acetylase OafA/YrhL
MSRTLNTGSGWIAWPAVVSLTFGLALLSFRFIEEPMTRLGRKLS